MDPVARTSPQLARCNGLDLCWDSFGDRAAPALLLVMGLGQQLVGWDDELCEQLARRGYWVVRFDNRDVGKSTHLTGGGRFTLWELLRLRLFGIPPAAPYTLRDMALDAVGLLDALGVQRAHVVGISMGGMIAQELTMAFPERVLTLTSIMSSTGERRLPGPTPEATKLLLQRPARSREEFVAQFVAQWKVLRVGAHPEDEPRDPERAERIYARGTNPAGAGRQLRAIFASGSRKQRLAAVRTPTLVVHGTVDPLIPAPCGQATADAIAGSRLVWIENLGHALPHSLWPRLLDEISRHAVT